VNPKDKIQAFEMFKEEYQPYQSIYSNKQLLKRKYEEAKRLGEKANGFRVKISTKSCLVMFLY
jgi:kinesin family protein 6/9